MEHPKGRCCFCKEVVLFLLGVVALYFLANSLIKESSLRKHKEIVRQLIGQGLDSEDVDSLVDRYFAPNIELEYPPGFNLPPLNTNRVSGIETAKKVAEAWAADTEHQFEILEVVAEGDMVAMFYKMDRVFIMDEETQTHEDHPGAYFFQFKNGQITKITAVFDVLPEVEEFKEQKY